MNVGLCTTSKEYIAFILNNKADIIVYKDDACLEPYILVECKKEEVSEAEFSQAIEQAYSYAFALPGK